MQETKTIIFVDDDKLVRQSTVAVLTALGYKVLSAESGKEGIEFHQQKGNEIDLITSFLSK